MNPDHDVDRVLAAAGLDPDPAFVDRLQRGLTDELQRSTIRPARRRRVALIAAAAAVAIGVGAVVAVAVSDSDERTIVDAPDTTTVPTTVSSPDTIDSSPTSAATTLVATTMTTAAPSTVVSTTNPTTSTSTSTLPTSIVAVVDMTDVGELVEPELIVSIPASPAGDLFDGAFAAPAGSDRIAVLDLGTGEIHFLGPDGSNLGDYSSSIPRRGDARVVMGLFVGPDDIVYTVESGPSVEDFLATVAAYAVRDGRYTEVARTHVGAMDGVSRQFNSAIDTMPYVDETGQASGETLGVDDLTDVGDGTNVLFTRGDRSWQIEFVRPGRPRGQECGLCTFSELGPDGSVVIPQSAPMRDGSIARHITVLADTVTSFVTDWTYIGPQGDSLLFSRSDQDSIDLGRIRLSSLSGG